jgi:hypothetical protein
VSIFRRLKQAAAPTPHLLTRAPLGHSRYTAAKDHQEHRRTPLGDRIRRCRFRIFAARRGEARQE